jgi:hypothetical protein
MVTTHRIQALRPVLIGLFAVVLVGGLMLTFQLHGSPRAFAATLQQVAGKTCVQAPNPTNCNNQDPILQGCVADANTVGQADIKEAGQVVGSVERRFSLKCHSWWARVFDKRPGSQTQLSLTIAGKTISHAPTFVSNQYRILYSPMTFNASPSPQLPMVTGELPIDGITPPVSTTLPPMTPTIRNRPIWSPDGSKRIGLTDHNTRCGKGMVLMSLVLTSQSGEKTMIPSIFLYEQVMRERHRELQRAIEREQLLKAIRPAGPRRSILAALRLCRIQTLDTTEATKQWLQAASS